MAMPYPQQAPMGYQQPMTMPYPQQPVMGYPSLPYSAQSASPGGIASPAVVQLPAVVVLPAIFMG
jgi:hypothetical protein